MKKFIFAFSFLALTSAASPAYVYAQTNDAVISTNRQTNPRNNGPLSFQEITQMLREPILAMPSVRGITIDEANPSTIKVFAAREMEIHLNNFQERVNREGANRGDEFDHFIRVIASTVSDNDPFKPETLRVVIRTKDALNEFELQTAFNDTPNLLVRRPFIGNLEEVVVGDSATSIALMPLYRLQDLHLNLDEVFAKGETNIAAAANATKWFQENGLLVGELDGVYESSLLKIDNIWESISERLGGPIAVAIPVRGKLYIGLADKPEDLQKLDNIAKTLAVGPHALTNKILLRQNGAWIERTE